MMISNIHNSPNQPRGYVLLELVVAAAVFAILAVAIGEMTVAMTRLYAREQALADAERRLAIGIEPLREAAKGASAVVPSRTINGVAYVSGTSTVAFALPAVNQSGALLTGTDYVGFRKSSADPTLIVQDIDAAAGSFRRTGTRTIAGFVDAFRVRYNTSTIAAADWVEFYLETKRVFGGNTARVPLVTRITLENH